MLLLHNSSSQACKARAGSLPLPAAGGGGGDPAQRTLAEVLDMKAFSTEH